QRRRHGVAAQDRAESRAMTESNPRLAHAKALYLEGIRDGRIHDALEAHVGDRYLQHSTGVRNGKEGFIEFFEAFVARNPKREIDIVRAFDDGRYVFVHAYQSLNDGAAKWVTMDMFDTDAEGRAIEHWDCIVPFKGPTPSGHTQVDGATEITDLDRTADSEALVRAMLADLLMEGGDVTKAPDYVAENYIQHNVEVADGLASFQERLAAPDRKLFYDEIVLCIAKGNFVATFSKARWGDQPYAQMDLFRLEGGKIVEHWDAAEPVPAPEDVVNEGKF
ncbi:MAG: nuclear transport factor 2 family protein, partial [Myxococcota bacterium]